MKWSIRIRQIHRWLSVAFTATVVFAFVALSQESPVIWASYLPLFPLALLWLTGASLFVLPCLERRGARHVRTSDPGASS